MSSIYQYFLAIILMLYITASFAKNTDQLIEEEKFIEKYEGFSSAAYTDSNGQRVIGYGHAVSSDEHYNQITKRTSETILIKDIKALEIFIKNTVNVPLSWGQTEALISLIYNWGERNFLKSKGLKYLNQGNYRESAIEFFSKEKGVVNINGKFSKGLYKRRQAELELWND
jgi:lysozyme